MYELGVTTTAGTFNLLQRYYFWKRQNISWTKVLRQKRHTGTVARCDTSHAILASASICSELAVQKSGIDPVCTFLIVSLTICNRGSVTSSQSKVNLHHLRECSKKKYNSSEIDVQSVDRVESRPFCMTTQPSWGGERDCLAGRTASPAKRLNSSSNNRIRKHKTNKMHRPGCRSMPADSSSIKCLPCWPPKQQKNRLF